MKAEVVETRDIPLDELVIGRFQVRTEETMKGIEELAESIRVIGLLEPIVVCPAEEDPDKFEVLTGQRRFYAHRHLELPTIRACILADRVEPEVAAAISLTENLMRKDLTEKEKINACTMLFRKYMSLPAVAEETGLSHHLVSKYVKYDQLVPKVRELYDAGAVSLDLAIRAQRAAQNEEGVVDEEAAHAYTMEMAKMSAPQRANLESAAKQNPGATAEKIIEAGRKPPKQIKLTVHITPEADDGLNRYADAVGAKREDAAERIIVDTLDDKGFL